MRFGSVCSGIEAASVAWNPLGWQTAWVSEIEKFPCEVLNHHYPTVPNHGDMTNLKHMILNGEIEAPDVLVGGTPCQSFSCAGLRKSLEDDRGQLCVTFIHTLDSIDLVRRNRGELPAIAVWENVPGVLSTKDNAFGCFLAGLVGEECALIPAGKRWSDAGYVSGPERSAAWRILDAQYFGLAQRRRRVFVVASARDGFNPAKVLFEPEGVRRDTPPSRETGESVTHPVAPSLTSSGRGVERGGESRGQDPVVAVAFQQNTRDEVRLMNGDGSLAHGQAGAEIVRDGSPSLTCNHEAPIVVHGTQDPCTSDICFALGWNNGQENAISQYGHLAGSLTARHDSSPCADRGMNVVAFEPGVAKREDNPARFNDNLCSTLRSNMGDNQPAVAIQMQVRRLTPTECERLQGFPDGYTNIKPNCPDGPRYKALGNSMAVPVMRWIGKRIQKEVSK